VQVLEWVSHHDGLGGAANVAQNLVAMGCEVWLAGVVGDDAKGVRLRQLVQEQGIHSDDILTDTSGRRLPNCASWRTHSRSCESTANSARGSATS
jgi:bifunctional ADP-heptose synthase (sugar kinase/adenylyltransferase)